MEKVYNKNIPLKKLGRPRKSKSEGTKAQVKAREYMRKYNRNIAIDVHELNDMNEECQNELRSLKDDMVKIVNLLDKCNLQTQNILNEKIGKIKHK